MLHSLYLAYYFDHILLVPIRTLYSTHHKFNESFIYVRVFQDTGVYVQVLNLQLLD